jgi:phosphoribosylformylglycinamidine synthase
LDFPIVSGNVSLYNESKATGGGSAILPTPAIGGVGLLEDWRRAVGIGIGGNLMLVGSNPADLHLGQSLWAREIRGIEAGDPPSVDLELERRHGEFVRYLIAEGIAKAVHDVSDGGLLVAAAEMALAGNLELELHTERTSYFFDRSSSFTAKLFGEQQGRYLVSVYDDRQALDAARRMGIDCERIGILRDIYADPSVRPENDEPFIVLEDWDERGYVSLANLRAAHEGFFERLMRSEPAIAG